MTDTSYNAETLSQQLAELQSLVYYDSGNMNANTNFSLFYHTSFVQKLRYEMANMMMVAEQYRTAFETLRTIADAVQKDDMTTLAKVEQTTGSQFLKNLITLLTDRWPENKEHSPYARMAYWILPTLLSGASRGKDFIENTIYYEGLLMATCGHYTYPMIQFRLMGLLGIQLSLNDCLTQ